MTWTKEIAYITFLIHNPRCLVMGGTQSARKEAASTDSPSMILAVLLSLATKQLKEMDQEKKDNKENKGNKDKDLGSLIDCGY